MDPEFPRLRAMNASHHSRADDVCACTRKRQPWRLHPRQIWPVRCLCLYANHHRKAVTDYGHRRTTSMFFLFRRQRQMGLFSPLLLHHSSSSPLVFRHRYLLINLYGCRFLFAASAALINSHQLTLLYVELPVLENLPFMKSTFAQGFTLMFLGQFLFLENKDICHKIDAC